MTVTLQDAVLHGVSSKPGETLYKAIEICKLFGITNWMVAISPLSVGAEKLQNVDNEQFVLTVLGVKRIIHGLDEDSRSKVDEDILHHFGVYTNSKTKQVAARAAKDKPLEKNTFVGYLRTVFPELNIETNWVVPGTENTLDIFIRYDKKQLSIAIICDESRDMPLQLTDVDMDIAFKVKATIAHEIKWLLFRDYKAKRPGYGFFQLIAAIKDIIYGPFSSSEVEKKKPSTKRKTKRSKEPKEHKEPKEPKESKKAKKSSKTKNGDKDDDEDEEIHVNGKKKSKHAKNTETDDNISLMKKKNKVKNNSEKTNGIKSHA
jgi:hypothetical protein